MQLHYDPNRLLDRLMIELRAKNDAELARALEINPPIISKIRHRRMPLGSALLLRIHDVSGLSVRQLQEILGDRRKSYRLSAAQGRRERPPAARGTPEIFVADALGGRLR